MPIDDEGTRQRTRIIRLAFCERDESGKPEPARAFAARLNIGEQAWNNFETRKQTRIGLDSAVRLVEHYAGLTLDYIYLNDKSGLPVPIQREIFRAEKEASQEAPSRSGRTSLKAGRAGRSPSKRASTSSRA